MTLRTLAVAATSVAVAATPAAATAARGHRRHGRHCTDTNATPRTASKRALQAAVVCLVNHEREKYGLPALRTNGKLSRAAQGWTDTMVGSGYFGHSADFAATISAVGFAWSQAGQNIATGYRTPRRVVNAWMASPGHCRNILNPDYREVGTGVVDRGIRPYGSGPSTWTQDFALGLRQRPRSYNWAPADTVC
jgi:uncharacterized protein YkwD